MKFTGRRAGKAASLALTACLTVPALAAPSDKPIGKIEQVAAFSGPMLTGVTVSQTGRIFVNYPRWGDPVQFTVAEVKNGRAVAFPSLAFNRQKLVAVQSVVVDPKDRLWILDTGSVKFGPPRPGGAKLVGVNLRTNKVFKTIVFPSTVALPTTYLNDIRFDLRRNLGFITDSGEKGPGGIIVVNLQTGKSWRHLDNHPSVQPVKGFLPIVEGQPVMTRKPGQPPKPLGLKSDGIAISADGKRLYYCPLASRHLYAVSTAELAKPDGNPAVTVKDLGEKGSGSDGLESDSAGRVYLTAYEANAILRRRTDGLYETIVHDPRILWPDTMSLASNGYLYFTANQLHRQANYHNGRDLRVKPYSIFRVKVDARPVRLK